MNTYIIWLKKTGTKIATVTADDQPGALDEMARTLGYSSHVDLMENVSGYGLREIEIYELEKIR